MPNLLQIGMLLIFLGIILVFISSITSITQNKSNIKSAGGIFIGPFPIYGFASDKKTLYLLFAIALIVFVIFFLLRKFIS